MRLTVLFHIVLLFTASAYAQQTVIRGKIVDNQTYAPLADIRVELDKSSFSTTTDSEGIFELSDSAIPDGNQLLLMYGAGYLAQQLPLIVYTQQLNELSMVFLAEDVSHAHSESGLLFLADDELSDDDSFTHTTSSFLQATDDVFLKAVGFDFSQAYFRPRGFDSDEHRVLINGIAMNNPTDGRAQWAEWGGLSDMQRNQEFSKYSQSNRFSFGGLGGITQMTMQADAYKKGGKISYAHSNRNYQGRVTASYRSGKLDNGWAYALLVGRRFADHGYNDATLYDANSFAASLSKELHPNHRINVTSFFTPARRGKSAANTQEVYDLKGNRYNPYWGLQEGKTRNSRIKKTALPVVLFNYQWHLSEKYTLDANLGYQWGYRSDSRLGYDKISSPDPTHYQNLPSYWLGIIGDPEAAAIAKNNFIDDGQINWLELYKTNLMHGETSRYYLYDDRVEEQHVTGNLTFQGEIHPNIGLSAAVNYKKTTTQNYAQMSDLLGGNGYLDIDVFKNGLGAQSNLNQPDRVVGVGDDFKYNYDTFFSQIEGFVQLDFSYSNIDFYLAVTGSTTNFWREGKYRNGSYPNNNDSYGKSEELSFSGYGLKGGIEYRLSGRHALTLNGAYLYEPPHLRNSFSNIRQNNHQVMGLKNIRKVHGDIAYNFRSPFFNAQLSAYYSTASDASRIGFFYADGIFVDDRNVSSAFVQEVLTGVNTQYMGVEFGAEAQILPSVKVRGVAAVGQHLYVDNPELYLTSDSFSAPQFYGETLLKNYKIPGAPQRAFQIGVEHRNPKFWWVGVSANYFSHTYSNVAPLTRTKNFYLNSDGTPFENYDSELAKKLLKQERFDGYFLMQVVGGKTWKIDRYYLGLSVAASNILNQQYKTGGFEQGRNANYQTLLEDASRKTPVFGSKYWYGYGATYTVGLSLRF